MTNKQYDLEEAPEMKVLKALSFTTEGIMKKPGKETGERGERTT